MEYQTIFIISDKNTNILYPLLIIIFFSLIIRAILIYDELTFGSKIYKFFASIFIFFLMISFTYTSYFGIIDLKDKYKNHKYQIVEGIVSNYKPEIEKKQSESFEVNGIKFSISSYTFGGGFNKTGLFYNGKHVKIYYINNENLDILRIDVPKTLKENYNEKN